MMQEHIDEIMDSFNFNRVAKAMEALDWGWAHSENITPTEYELRKKGRELLQEAKRYWQKYGLKEDYTVGSGGFYATYNGKYDYFKLVFALDSWNTECLN